MCTGGMTWSAGARSGGTCSMQSTGQKGTQASHPVHPSTTTASSLGRFFFLVYFSGMAGRPPRKSFILRSLKTAIGPPGRSSIRYGTRLETEALLGLLGEIAADRE